VDAFIVTLGGANGQTEMCSSGDPEERPYRLGTCGSHDPSTGITVTVKAQAFRSAETGASIPPTGASTRAAGALRRAGEHVSSTLVSAGQRP